MVKQWTLLLGLTALGVTLFAQETAKAPQTTEPNKPVVASADPNAIDPSSPLGQLLTKINDAAKGLKSCQATVDYLFIQDPGLLDSRTLRKGNLYYQKNDKGSRLRMTFDTVKQDEGDEQKKKEDYLFDGVWLTKVDHTLRQIDQYQQAPVDKPIEVFDYISHNFPIVGFSGTDTLARQFRIRQIDPKEDELNLYHLLLLVKPDSVYKDDYDQIDLWVDGKLYLPVRMVSVSTQGDIYDLRLSRPELNKTIAEKQFVVEMPKDFSKNTKTLDSKDQGKDTSWPREL